VFKSVGGKDVVPHMYDGNYVVASLHPRPWQKQLTMLAGYLYFYNPVSLAFLLLRMRSPLRLKPAGMQIIGMMGLVMTVLRTTGWMFRLMFGRITRYTQPPISKFKMRSVDGSPAGHDTPRVSVQIARPLVRLRVPTREAAVGHS
jgi:hypothetical protein